MKKHIFKITLIIAIMLSIFISGYNYLRMTNPPPPEMILEMPVQTINPNSAQEYTVFYKDSENQYPTPDMGEEEFAPSNTALEVKFRIDMFIRLISSLSPLIAPAIV